MCVCLCLHVRKSYTPHQAEHQRRKARGEVDPPRSRWPKAGLAPVVMIVSMIPTMTTMMTFARQRSVAEEPGGDAAWSRSGELSTLGFSGCDYDYDWLSLVIIDRLASLIAIIMTSC